MEEEEEEGEGRSRQILEAKSALMGSHSSVPLTSSSSLTRAVEVGVAVLGNCDVVVTVGPSSECPATIPSQLPARTYISFKDTILGNV